MGKALKASFIPKPGKKNKIAFKKTKEKNLSEKLINYYFNTLSDDFGSTSDLKNESKKNVKRKRTLSAVVDDAEEQEVLDIQEKQIKKVKLDNEPPSEEMVCEDANVNTCLNKTAKYNFKYISNCLQSNVKLDLFCIDEVKQNMELMHNTDWFSIVCDEISLEGLEGITLEALWTRLNNVFDLPVLIKGKEDLFWHLLCSIYEIEFFTLDNSREDLVVHNRNAFLCVETGLVSEPVTPFLDIYPYQLVNSKEIRGSCKDFQTRIDSSTIMRQSSLETVLDNYNSKLVIVASQQMRQQALYNELCDPLVELSDNEYGFLERVGRSRKLGELTQGNVSIQQIMKDSKLIFHIRKSLEKKLLLKSQFFILRNMVNMQNKTGKLLHLSRFFYKFKSKAAILIEEIVEYLRNKPSYMVEFSEFRKQFPHLAIAKILKNPDFLKYVKTDIYVLFRELYPNAPPSEWRWKNKATEKKLRLIQLNDPHLNVQAVYGNNEPNSDDECLEEETSGFKMINYDFLKEIFLHIFLKGKEGVTLQDLEKIIGFDFYSIRSALKKLQAKNVVDTLRCEIGKQKYIKYYARCFYEENVPKNILKFISHDTIKSEEKCDLKINQFEMLTDSEYINLSEKILRGCNSLIKINGAPYLRKIGIGNHSEKNKKEENYDDYKFVAPLMDPLPIFFNENVETQICSVKSAEKLNFSWKKKLEIFIAYTSEDVSTKTLLFKSLVSDVENNINFSEQHYTIDYSALVNERKQMLNVTSTYSKDFLLGENPEIIFEEENVKANNMTIVTTIISSDPLKEYVYEYDSYNNWDKKTTAVALSRINILLRLVNKHTVINNLHTLLKGISTVEAQETQFYNQGKMDKNTLHRLLVKLSNEGYIKIYKMVVTCQNKMKSEWFILHPTADSNHPVIKTVKDQIPIKFFFTANKMEMKEAIQNELLKDPFVNQDDIQASIHEWKILSIMKEKQQAKYNRGYGKKLGYQPKFVRLQHLHGFLFYLIYQNNYIENIAVTEMPELKDYFTQDELSEIPPIYSKEINWKMFVPPLPEHVGWPQGWCLMCDVLYRLPLSLFLKICNLTWEIPALEEYLQHPIKKYYLLKYIPYNIRSVLLHRRKYIQEMCELINRLCFMGLAQLGPQNIHTKDELFMFINRNATLLETSSSSPSYHKITPKEYPIISFEFNSYHDVNEYWSRLWTISMLTPLGQRKIMQGKYVTIEDSSIKPILLAALKPQSPMGAVVNDAGHVPGDKLGAAGLDSSMWAHIKRNWVWSHAPRKRRNTVNPKTKKFNPIKYKDLLDRKTKKIYLQDSTSVVEKPKQCVRTKLISKKKLIEIRKFRVSNKIVREYYDAKDKLIIKRNGRKIRLPWNEVEDKILIVCKVAAIFLFGHKKQIIPYVVIRDILHALNPESSNKTSQACKRRIMVLMKTLIYLRDLEQKAGNLINVFPISKYYGAIIYYLQNSPKLIKFEYLELVTSFTYLVSFLYDNYSSIENILWGNWHIVDYFSPNSVSSFSSLLTDENKSKMVFKNPISQEELQIEIVKSVIISALNGGKSNPNWSFHLFTIYKKYSEYVLRQSVFELKKSRLISFLKTWSKKCKASVQSPFQLSNKYVYMQAATLSVLSFHTVYQNYREIIGENGKYINIDATKTAYKHGKLFAYNEISSFWSDINYVFNLPTNAYVLNPYIEDQSKIKHELAVKFQDLLKEKMRHKDEPKNIPNEIVQQSPVAENEEETESIQKYLRKLQSTVKVALTKTPCFFNQLINENFAKLMSSETLELVNHYLEIIVNELIVISVKLINNSKESSDFFKNLYLKKTNKLRPTYPGPSKTLLLRFRILIYNIKTYFKCFPNSDIHLLEYTDESKIDNDHKMFIMDNLKRFEQDECAMIQSENISEADDNQNNNNNSLFFKWQRPMSHNTHKTLLNTYDKDFEEIPDIEEIEEEMMTPSDNLNTRKIPYINDIASLLFKQIPEKYKDYFVAQYPIFEKLAVTNLEDFKNNALKGIFAHNKRDMLLAKLDMFHKKCPPNEENVAQAILSLEGQESDILLSKEIISFVEEGQFLGVSGKQIKEKFLSRENNLSLITIIQILIDSYVILRAGISEIFFIHHKFQDDWLTKTFVLPPLEKELFNSVEINKIVGLKEELQERISKKMINVLLMPWVRIDGSINQAIFDKWLTQVLSHCLENPKIWLCDLFQKFIFVKPVEIFFILEVLQEFNCLQILIQERPEVSLFSDFEIDCKIEKATMLDDFSKMYVEVFNHSALAMGFILDREE